MNLSGSLVPRILLSTLMLAAQAVSAAPPHCEAVQFTRGSFSATVQGEVDPEGVWCYSIATVKGQTADLSVKSKHNNTIFSIEGLVDGRDQYTFTTEKKTYKVFVGQLMKAVDKDRFTLTITIR